MKVRLCAWSGTRVGSKLTFLESRLGLFDADKSFQSGEVQNLAAFCPGNKEEVDGEGTIALPSIMTESNIHLDYNQSASKEHILNIFSAYHPTVKRLIK